MASGSSFACADASETTTTNPADKQKRAISVPPTHATLHDIVRRDHAGALGDDLVLFRPPVRGEVEHLLLALAAEFWIDIGHDHLVGERCRLRDDAAVGIDDAGAADQA